jgi:hypothetical protein
VQGRTGTVMAAKAERFRSTENAIAFDGAGGKLEYVLLRKLGGAGSSGRRFEVLEGKVNALVRRGICQQHDGVRVVQDRLDGMQGDVRAVKQSVQRVQHSVEAADAGIAAGVERIQRGVARVERAVEALAEASRITNRLVTALALGEVDCPRYAWLVPEEKPEGGWKAAGSKAVHWLHDLHSRQVRLVLVCAHDFQAVPCGPDGKGYPIKIEKDWVKSFFRNFGPVIKVGLFAARAAVLLSGAGVLALPFLPPDYAEDDLVGQVKKHWQLNSIDRMLEECGKQMDQAVESTVGQAEVHDELGRSLADATATASLAFSTSAIAPASATAPPLPPSPALQAWAGESYRSLRAVLLKGDPQLLRTGLVQARTAPDFWIAPKNAAAFEAASASAAELHSAGNSTTRFGGV